MQDDPGELWKRMGKAMWSVQLLEFVIAHFIVTNKHPLPTTKEELENALGQEFRQTLGQLARAVNEKQNSPKGLEDELSWLVDERNWLAHRIRTQNHNDIYHVEKFKHLLDRLTKLDLRAMNLAKTVTELLEKWTISRGVSREELDAEVARLYLQGKSS